VASLDFASENRVFLNLLLGDATYFINLDNIGLTDVFRTTHCLSVRKSIQIGLGVLKMWSVKHSGPFFGPPCIVAVSKGMGAVKLSCKKVRKLVNLRRVPADTDIGRVSYVRIYLCYFCFR